MPQGKVKWFSTEKAYGFIEQDNDNDIFVHVTGLAEGVTALDKDQVVEYEVEQGRKGPQATNVKPAASGAPVAEVVEVTEEVVVDDEGDVVAVIDDILVTEIDANGDVVAVDEEIVVTEPDETAE